MIEQALSDAAQKLGFNSDAVSACGVYDKYLISLYNESGNNVFYINYLVDPDADYEMMSLELGQKIKEIFDEYSIVSYAADEGGMTVEADCPIPKFFEALDYCIELLSHYEVIGCDRCTSCGAQFDGRPVKKVRKGCKSFIVCEGCALETLEKYNKETAEIAPPTKKQKNAATLAAAAGGLIGALLYIPAYAWLYPVVKSAAFDVRYIFCLLALATSALCYLGYTIFCKKSSKSAYITVGLSSVLFSAIGQYVGYVAMLITTVGGGVFPPVSSIYLMPLRSTAASAELDYSSSFYVLFAISVLFAICGSIIFLLGLYEKNHKPKEEITIETVTKLG